MAENKKVALNGGCDSCEYVSFSLVDYYCKNPDKKIVENSFNCGIVESEPRCRDLNCDCICDGHTAKI